MGPVAAAANDDGGTESGASAPPIVWQPCQPYPMPAKRFHPDASRKVCEPGQIVNRFGELRDKAVEITVLEESLPCVVLPGTRDKNGFQVTRYPYVVVVRGGGELMAKADL